MGAVIATCRLIACLRVERLIGSKLRISCQQGAIVSGIGVAPGVFLGREYVQGPWCRVPANMSALHPRVLQGPGWVVGLGTAAAIRHRFHNWRRTG